MSAEDWLDSHLSDPLEPWPVECDCCHRTFGSDKMVVEEGDRWECFDCWERLNEKERRGEPCGT